MTSGAPSPSSAAAPLPHGTVTFLFTDLEGSTRLWEEHPDEMQGALARHDAILRDVIEAHGGMVVKSTGDGVHAVFPIAEDAVVAALEAQRALQREPWATAEELRVRMGIHTGSAELRDDDYYGPAVNRAARLANAAHGGQVVLSQTAAMLVTDALPTGASLLDLGEHRLRDVPRPEHAFQLNHPVLRSGFPPLRTADRVPGNLPRYTDAFIGREQAMADVSALLDESPVVTLLGVGGVGKTRLAVSTAAAISHRFPDGTWIVGLGPVADPALVPATVATTLGVAEQPGRPVLETLLNALEPRRVLLVLDNCEHVLEACAALVEQIVDRCPDVRVVVTSREALGVRGEQRWQVPPLRVPDPDAPQSVASVMATDSGQLFLARALAVRPEFSIDEDNATAVADVCTQLDGIPLALELAAARIAMMTPGEVASRLDERFRLLADSSAPPESRHATMHDVVAWSYDLLDERERVLFDRLAAFAGAFTLDDAEAVCGGAGLTATDVLHGISALAAKSLVLVQTGRRRTHYRLLRTLRQFAVEQLEQSGDLERVTALHAVHYRAVAAAIGAGVRGPDEQSWLNRFERSLPDLRAAIAWYLDRQPAAALELVVHLADASHTRGYWDEAELAISVTLDRAPDAPPRVRARAMAAAALFTVYRSDLERWEQLTQQSIETCTAADIPALPEACSLLAMLRAFTGHPGEGRALAEYGLEIALAQDDLWSAGYAASTVTWTALSEGDLDGAERSARANLDRARILRNPSRIIDALQGLAAVVAARGQPVAALSLAEESAGLADEIGNRAFLRTGLIYGSDYAHDAGDNLRALELRHRCIATDAAAGAFPLLGEDVAAFAVTLHAVGADAEAAEMLAAADEIRTRWPFENIFPGGRRELEAAARNELATPEYDTARAAGRDLGVATVARRAQSIFDRVSRRSG